MSLADVLVNKWNVIDHVRWSFRDANRFPSAVEPFNQRLTKQIAFNAEASLGQIACHDVRCRCQLLNVLNRSFRYLLGRGCDRCFNQLVADSKGTNHEQKNQR